MKKTLVLALALFAFACGNKSNDDRHDRDREHGAMRAGTTSSMVAAAASSAASAAASSVASSAAAMTADLQAQLADLQAQQKELNADNDRLQTQLASAKTAADQAKIKAELDENKKRREDFDKHVNDLKSAPPGSPRQLEAQIDTISAQEKLLDDQKAQLDTQLAAAKADEKAKIQSQLTDNRKRRDDYEHNRQTLWSQRCGGTAANDPYCHH